MPTRIYIHTRQKHSRSHQCCYGREPQSCFIVQISGKSTAELFLMTSHSPAGLFREPCEDDSCGAQALPTFYCAQCDCSFCDICWDKQPAHRPRKRGTDGQAHEKIDRLVVERYRNIFESTSDSQEQENMHKDDEDTTWFGIGRNKADEPVFEDYEQYATLMEDSLSEAHKIRYPQLVSFIGQTGKADRRIRCLLC